MSTTYLQAAQVATAHAAASAAAIAAAITALPCSGRDSGGGSGDDSGGRACAYGGCSRRTRLLGDQLWLADAGSWQIADRYYTAS